MTVCNDERMAELACSTFVTADIPYGKSSDPACRLDLYRPFEISNPRPVLFFIHGGGWAAEASRTSWSLWFLPFLARGWVVANIGYRSSRSAKAPAAINDCLDALIWLDTHAGDHEIEVDQLVIGGLSAGGLLALRTAMQATRPQPPTLAQRKPVAIINWCGITDIAELLDQPHRQDFAVDWIGTDADAAARVGMISPVAHVHRHLPPVITIHGTNDQIVPFSQAIRLHDRLEDLGVSHRLIPLAGVDHGTLPAYAVAYPEIFAFLGRHGIGVTPRSSIGGPSHV